MNCILLKQKNLKSTRILTFMLFCTSASFHFSHYLENIYIESYNHCPHNYLFNDFSWNQHQLHIIGEIQKILILKSRQLFLCKGEQYTLEDVILNLFFWVESLVSWRGYISVVWRERSILKGDNYFLKGEIMLPLRMYLTLVWILRSNIYSEEGKISQ